jgi:hypothetical protein
MNILWFTVLSRKQPGILPEGRMGKIPSPQNLFGDGSIPKKLKI